MSLHRFKNRNEILDAIKRVDQNLADRSNSVCAIQAEQNRLLDAGLNKEAHHCGRQLRLAKTALKRLETDRSQLQQMLCIIDTPLLPGMGSDTSITKPKRSK